MDLHQIYHDVLISKKERFYGFKSHDGHILMQELLPICLRGVAVKKVLAIILDISSFFNKFVFQKTLDPSELDQLQEHVALTLCQMEKVFPSSFLLLWCI